MEESLASIAESLQAISGLLALGVMGGIVMAAVGLWK